MTLRNIFKTFAYTAAAFAMAACGDNHAYDYPTGACYDFATLVQAEPSGSLFTLQNSEDGPLISYTSKETFSPDSLQEFNIRLIIMYAREDGALPYTSGPIKLYGYRLLDNHKQIAEPDTLPSWESEPLKMQSITRTGTYLNMQMQLSCMRTANPKQLSLVYDSDRSSDSIPELRLIYHAREAGENYMTGYASFSLSPLWQNSKGVTISWMSPAGKQSKTFLKQ